MKFIKLFLLLAFPLVLLVSFWQPDPWITGSNPIDTDNITITKTTKYGTLEDGVTPYRSKVGSVIISHKTHEDAGLECVDCHHKNNNDARIKTCARCHYGTAGYDTLHEHCLGCHARIDKGPLECMQCH